MKLETIIVAPNVLLEVKVMSADPSSGMCLSVCVFFSLRITEKHCG